MPRIAAANIEEHIRNQDKRILNAARELFARNGYRDTDMAGIAAEMGLARNSLYRYYSNKDHILIAVVHNDMQPFFEQLAELERTVTDPIERIDAWIGLQMEIAAGPCHAMIRLLGEIPQSSKELLQQISALHEPPNRILREALHELLADSGRDIELLTQMIKSMVQSAAGLAMGRPETHDTVTEIRFSVRQILNV